jgi:hypothetical protein
MRWSSSEKVSMMSCVCVALLNVFFRLLVYLPNTVRKIMNKSNILISKNVTATEFSKFQQHMLSTQRLVSANTCTCRHRISSTKRD